MMKISNTFPPNYEEIVAAFNIKGRAGIIFTYGNTIYNPSKITIPPDLIAHEEIHAIQQVSNGLTPELWWASYIEDPKFRYEQELEAYQAQYDFAVAHYGRDQRRKLLDHISKALAGPMYGSLVSPAQAKAAITSG